MAAAAPALAPVRPLAHAPLLACAMSGVVDVPPAALLALSAAACLAGAAAAHAWGAPEPLARLAPLAAAAAAAGALRAAAWLRAALSPSAVMAPALLRGRNPRLRPAQYRALRAFLESQGPAPAAPDARAPDYFERRQRAPGPTAPPLATADDY